MYASAHCLLHVLNCMLTLYFHYYYLYYYHCHRKEQLRVQLEEVVSKKDGDEQSRLFAADLLAKYSYYLN